MSSNPSSLKYTQRLQTLQLGPYLADIAHDVPRSLQTAEYPCRCALSMTYSIDGFGLYSDGFFSPAEETRFGGCIGGLT